MSCLKEEVLTCSDCLFFCTGYCVDKKKSIINHGHSEMCINGLINDELYQEAVKENPYLSANDDDVIDATWEEVERIGRFKSADTGEMVTVYADNNGLLIT